MFEDMEVFDQEAKNQVTITTEKLTKKEYRAKDGQLRQAYGDKVNKPGQTNSLGSKTIRSDKNDRRPHQEKDAYKKHSQGGALKKGEKAAEMEVEINEQGMEVEESGNVVAEPITTLDEYYQRQGVSVQN